MNIAGVSAASPASSIRQGQATTPATTLPSPAEAPAAKQTAPAQQSGHAHHSRHHRGGAQTSGPASNASQPSTNATNIVNLLS